MAGLRGLDDHDGTPRPLGRDRRLPPRRSPVAAPVRRGVRARPLGVKARYARRTSAGLLRREDRFAKNGYGWYEFHTQVRTRKFDGDFVAVLDGTVRVGGRDVTQRVLRSGRRRAMYSDTGKNADLGSLGRVLHGAVVRGRCPTCGSALRRCKDGFYGCVTYTRSSGCMTKIYQRV